MKAIKEMILRKYNDYFIALKNNSFKPEIYFDALSLSHAYLANYHKKPGVNEDLWVLLLEALEYPILEESYPSHFNTIEGLNNEAKSKYSENAKPFIDELQKCIVGDEHVINEVFRKFYVRMSDKVVKISFDDIKHRWGVGIVKENR